MVHDDAICSAIPYRHVQVSLFFCFTHSAWELHIRDGEWADDHQYRERYSNDVGFGPFDTDRDVYAQLCAELLARFVTPAGPRQSS